MSLYAVRLRKEFQLEQNAKVRNSGEVIKKRKGKIMSFGKLVTWGMTRFGLCSRKAAIRLASQTGKKLEL